MEKKTDKEQELRELIQAMPQSYDALVIGASHYAKKNGKVQEMIDYIRNENPTCSDLVLFLGTIDDRIPKPFDDADL